jgi:hypothetical protein
MVNNIVEYALSDSTKKAKCAMELLGTLIYVQRITFAAFKGHSYTRIEALHTQDALCWLTFATFWHATSWDCSVV